MLIAAGSVSWKGKFFSRQYPPELNVWITKDMNAIVRGDQEHVGNANLPPGALTKLK